MVLSWRRRCRGAAKKHEVAHGSMMEVISIPSHFCCPISLELMKDPVTLSTGITYDRTSIETWIEAGNVTCPVTNKVLRNMEPIPNHGIRKIIQDWCVENRSYGVERIPTPRIPLSSHDVFEILSKIEAAIRHSDEEQCLEIVKKIKTLCMESERNKQCIVANGGCRVISTAFEAFSKRDSVEKHVLLTDEMLSTLTMTMSNDFDRETKAKLSTYQSLKSLVWFLRFGSLSSQKNAIIVLQSVTSTSLEMVESIVKMEGVLESVVKLIKEPICQTTTKASLLTIYHIISSSSSSSVGKVIIQKLLEMRLIDILLEIIVDSERSLCEKSLGVLDAICSYGEGKKKANENALTVPLTVKKMLRESSLGTELSVSILWKLVRKEQDSNKKVILEALEVGALQKLLLILQIGCSETTKIKATELLKMMTVIISKDYNIECVDSLDFKNIKRSF